MFRKTAFTLILFWAAPAAAFAHPEFEKADALVDSAYTANLQLPHGCSGEPTTEIDIKLPEGFVAAKAVPRTDWQIEVVNGKFKKSHQIDGQTISEGPIEIRWKNGNLPDEYPDTLTFSGRFSGIPAGTAVPFVLTQFCGKKKVVWDDIPKHGKRAHDLRHPAPAVMLTDASHPAQHEAHDDHGPVAGAFTPVAAGDLEITVAAIKAMTPGQPVGGGYLTIVNKGKADDRLVSVSLDEGAKRVELHEMAMNNDVMTMRKLNDGILLPAGQTVEMKPGGLHLMIMGVKKPFKAGEVVHATLVFEKAGQVELAIPVQDMRPGKKHGMKM
jgi:periplasmic copper chaperone A